MIFKYIYTAVLTGLPVIRPRQVKPIHDANSRPADTPTPTSDRTAQRRVQNYGYGCNNIGNEYLALVPLLNATTSATVATTTEGAAEAPRSMRLSIPPPKQTTRTIGIYSQKRKHRSNRKQTPRASRAQHRLFATTSDQHLRPTPTLTPAPMPSSSPTSLPPHPSRPPTACNSPRSLSHTGPDTFSNPSFADGKSCALCRTPSHSRCASFPCRSRENAEQAARKRQNQ